ncbi:MAG: FkbM family methyltransferase [Candidatus Omnitrophica bacterium]|nr:FkbM family methyltransferase [Candidatus Omnitrophota bacterium]
MLEISTIKDAIFILKRFGIRHAFGRFEDLVLIKKEERRKNKLYKKLKPQGRLRKNILGNTMQLDMNDFGIHRDLFLDGIREPQATQHLMQLLGKDDIVLEVGANIGYYVLIESRLCKKIYAVEPITENINNLKINIELNQCRNVAVFQTAFGAERTKKTMYISKKSNWHSFYPKKNIIKKLSVEMDSVDNFLKDKEKPTFLRMDVEGYELNILKGMQETLKNIKRLFIEVHADILALEETQELIEILRKNSFRPELIIKYDRPKFSKILPNDYINKIYDGDKGGYEIFFSKF